MVAAYEHRCEVLAVYLWASFQHHGGDLGFLQKKKMSQKSGHIRTPSGHTYGTRDKPIDGWQHFHGTFQNENTTRAVKCTNSNRMSTVYELSNCGTPVNSGRNLESLIFQFHWNQLHSKQYGPLFNSSHILNHWPTDLAPSPLGITSSNLIYHETHLIKDALGSSHCCGTHG